MLKGVSGSSVRSRLLSNSVGSDQRRQALKARNDNRAWVGAEFHSKLGSGDEIIGGANKENSRTSFNQGANLPPCLCSVQEPPASLPKPSQIVFHHRPSLRISSELNNLSRFSSNQGTLTSSQTQTPHSNRPPLIESLDFSGGISSLPLNSPTSSNEWSPHSSGESEGSPSVHIVIPIQRENLKRAPLVLGLSPTSGSRRRSIQPPPMNLGLSP